MNRLILTMLLFSCSIANAATVVLEVGYITDAEVPNGTYSFIVDSQVVDIGIIAKIMKTTLLNQSAGSYTAVIEVCNNAACSRTSVSYVIPDAPNVDDITLTVTVTRDE